MQTQIARSCEEMQNAGVLKAASLTAGSVLGLVGELGSGKTYFVKGLARGLGVASSIAVTSPTFVLLHEYPGGRLPLYHFDFYRLTCEREVPALGLEDYLEGDGVCVVEWADRFRNVFPARTEWIFFRFLDETSREIRCA